MNRTKLYKINYVVQTAIIGVASGLFVFWKSDSVVAYLISIFIVLLVAELFRRSTYGSLIRGVALVRKKKYSEAIVEFECFIDETDVKPWFNKVFLLSWSCYTINVKALAWNNIGACHYNLRQLRESREALDTAKLLDPYFPIPFFNIAKIDLLEDDEIRAKANFERSAELGLSGRLAVILASRAYGVSIPINRVVVFCEKLQDEAEKSGLKPYIDTIEKFPRELERKLSNTPENSEYALVMLDDDSTPMGFVVALLVKCFNYERKAAHLTMLEVHKIGYAEIVASDIDFLQLLQSHLDDITNSNDCALEFEIRKSSKKMTLPI